MFLRKPQQARQELLTIAKTQSNGCLYLQSIYCNYENLIDVNTLEFFLDNLETALSEQIGHLVAQDNVPPWLWRALGFISQMHNLELIRAIEKRAGTQLESLISQLAQSRLGSSYPERDDTFKFSYNVLCKICGQGLTDLLDRELVSEHIECRAHGIGNAIRRPDEHTCSLLRDLIHSKELFGDPPRPMEQGEAASVLAALGEHDAVLEAIRLWGVSLSEPLFSFWDPDAPMPLAKLKEIVEIVFKENAADMMNLPNLSDARSYSKLIPLLQPVLKECPPESQIARFAIELLMKLEDRSNEFIEFLRRFLKIEEFDFSTTNYLLYIGKENPLAFDVLVEHLEQTRSHNDNKWWDFAFALVHQEAIREKVAHILSEKEKSDDVLTFIGWPLEVLNQLDIEHAYEKVIETAFTNNTMFPYSATSAIRGLGKIDPERAAHAGKLALKRLRNVDSRLPKALALICDL